MYKKKKYIPLEPLVESPDSSWEEIAQRKLFESELTGKGYRKPLKREFNAKDEPIIANKNAKEETK